MKQIETFRVMVQQETGELMCLQTGLTACAAYGLAETAHEEHPEWRCLWVEPEETFEALISALGY